MLDPIEEKSTAYHLFTQRQHRLLAMHLALSCWMQCYDAVILERDLLARYLQLDILRRARIQQFLDDARLWFPQTLSVFSPTKDDALLWIILSRSFIGPAFETDYTIPDLLWRAKSLAMRVIQASQLAEGYSTINEETIVKDIALWSAGLTGPPTRP